MIGPASLRGRLLLCMGLGLSVLWLVLAVWLHGEVRDRVARVLDQRLAASARMVVSLLESDAAGDLKLQESGALPLGGIACEISSLREDNNSLAMRLKQAEGEIAKLRRQLQAQLAASGDIAAAVEEDGGDGEAAYEAAGEPFEYGDTTSE